MRVTPDIVYGGDAPLSSAFSLKKPKQQLVQNGCLALVQTPSNDGKLNPHPVAYSRAIFPLLLI